MKTKPCDTSMPSGAAKPLDRRLLRLHLEGNLNHRRRWKLLSLKTGDSKFQTSLTRSRKRAFKRHLLMILNILRFNVSSK